MYLETAHFPKRLLKVINQLDITPYKFSKELGYKGGETIYRLLDDKIKPSTSFFKRVENSSLPVNLKYLQGGLFEKPLMKNLKKGGYGNEIGNINGFLYPGDLDRKYLKRIGLHLAKIFSDFETDEFKIYVSIFGFHGLDFKFFIYSSENGNYRLDRKRTFGIEHDWRVISYVDHWKSLDNGWRSESLHHPTSIQGNKNTQKTRRKIEHYLEEIQNEIISINEGKYDYNSLGIAAFLKLNQAPELIYISDPNLPAELH